ncbi:macro domain-containing protein [Actinoplanes derwentensis]|uniref:Thoeris protein ThsA Macro domain-containing protein n=1 Tax=Actinoplanes derwentensis TaxID=113562 RepID=A0A1H1Y3U6_9ACTN|nr:macro domain-containing protein [Actinoplanes derwentensis]GID86740.1 hypothetical protein Ade03nite_56640 [Actinoplanes derwentensis]SDT15899.1 hypothetical protein SAMN04489716_2689 [Actinoplanes derwentensis]
MTIRYEPVHFTIVAIDVAGSGGRDDQLLLQMRADLRRMVGDALLDQGLDPADVSMEDLGDGVRLIVPASVTPARLLDPFVTRLGAALRAHRKIMADAARLRLRVAVHMGLLHRDNGGWAGEPLVHIARLLDAPAVRQVIGTGQVDLAVIVSGDVYDKVVRHGYGLDDSSYRKATIAVKETRTVAWLCAPGHSAPPGLEPTPEPPSAVTPSAVARVRRRSSPGRFRQAFGTRRGVRGFGRRLAVTSGGLLSGAALAVVALRLGAPVALAVVAPALPGVLWALAGTYAGWAPGHRLHRPEVTVTFRVGDLFDEDAHLVVGFTDTFDTSVTGDRIINSASVQGQLLTRLFDGDQRRLDRELAQALARHTPTGSERRDAKRLGKLVRYPLGTVAVLGAPDRHVFATAYSRMGNDLVPQSGVDDLWRSLSALWDAVYERGQRAPLAMPVVGSGAARIDQLSPQSLLKLVLISFVARSRQSLICRELRIVVHPGDLGAIDLPEIRRFLKGL